MQNSLDFVKYIEKLLVYNFKSFKELEEFEFNQHFVKIEGKTGKTNLLLAIRFVFGENINSLAIADWNELVHDTEKRSFVRACIATETGRGFIFERSIDHGAESFNINNQDCDSNLYFKTLEMNGIGCKYLDLLTTSAFFVLDDPQEVKKIIEEISKSDKLKNSYDTYAEEIDASISKISSLQNNLKTINHELKSGNLKYKIAQKSEELMAQKLKLQYERCLLNSFASDIEIDELNPKLVRLEYELESIPASEDLEDHLFSNLCSSFEAYQKSTCDYTKLQDDLFKAFLDVVAARADYNYTKYKTNRLQSALIFKETIRTDIEQINKRIQEIQKLNGISEELENNPEIMNQYDELKSKFEKDQTLLLTKCSIQGTGNLLIKVRSTLRRLQKELDTPNRGPWLVQQKEELLEKKQLLALLQEQFSQEMEEIEDVKRKLTHHNLAIISQSSDSSAIQLLKREFPGVIDKLLNLGNIEDLHINRKALLALLGESSDSLVVQTEETPLKVTKFLRRRRLPPVSCLPLTSIEEILPNDEINNFWKMIQHCNVDALVCPQLQDAFEMTFELKDPRTIVCHDGILFDSEGTVTVGMAVLEQDQVDQKSSVDLLEERIELLHSLNDRAIECVAKKMEIQVLERELWEIEVELENSISSNHQYSEDTSDEQLDLPQIETELKSKEIQHFKDFFENLQIHDAEVYRDFANKIKQTDLLTKEMSNLKTTVEELEKVLNGQTDDLENIVQKLNKMLKKSGNHLKTVKGKFEENLKIKLEKFQELNAKRQAFRENLVEYESIGEEFREKQAEYDECVIQLLEAYSNKCRSLLQGVIEGIDLNELVVTFNELLEKFQRDGGTGLYSLIKEIAKDSELINYQKLVEGYEILRNPSEFLAIRNKIADDFQRITNQLEEIPVIDVNTQQLRHLKTKKDELERKYRAEKWRLKGLKDEFKLVKEDRLKHFKACINDVTLFMTEVYTMTSGDDNAFVRCEFENSDEPYLGGVHFYGSMLCYLPDHAYKIVGKTLVNLSFLMARTWYLNCSILLMDTIEEDAINPNSIPMILKFFHEQNLFQIFVASTLKSNTESDDVKSLIVT